MYIAGNTILVKRLHVNKVTVNFIHVLPETVHFESYLMDRRDLESKEKNFSLSCVSNVSPLMCMLRITFTNDTYHKLLPVIRSLSGVCNIFGSKVCSPVFPCEYWQDIVFTFYLM